MKKKLLSFLCLLTLLFAIGCNKEEKQPVSTPTTVPTETATPTPTSTPTPTPSPTPTPIPENLAMTNLKKLPEAYSALLDASPNANVDYSQGLGYDIDMELTVNESLLEALEITGLDKISLKGTMDMKESLAADFALFLNETEVIAADAFFDFQNVMFNLPKYSANYASFSLEELLGVSTEELSSLSFTNYPSNQELYAFMETTLNNLVNCFEPRTEISENLTIGTGDYIMTGEMHTVVTNLDKLLTWVDTLQQEFIALYPDFASAFEEIPSDEELSAEDKLTNIIVHYYTDNNGSFAWEFYPDNQADASVVFISTEKGFCLYGGEESTPEIMFYSVATSDKTGTFYLPGDEEEGTSLSVDYELGNNTFSAHMLVDEVELTMDFTSKDNTTTMSYELVAEGMSVLMDMTSTATTADMSMTIASYGMKLGTLDMKYTLRDYVAPAVPQNTTDMATWESSLDQEALTNDLLQLMNDFPFLMDLIIGAGSNSETDVDDNRESTYTPDADYSDAFMNMTGYYIDEDGYVDFEPKKDEIMTIGQPSTGFDTLTITEDQKKALFDFAEASFATCDKYTDDFFWVWGSTQYNDVASYYSAEYSFVDANSWDNSIILDFDAVSGAFISASVNNQSKDESYRIANELLKILKIDYTITPEAAEEYTSGNGLAISAYDGAEYGSNYYNVSFEIYDNEY